MVLLEHTTKRLPEYVIASKIVEAFLTRADTQKSCTKEEVNRDLINIAVRPILKYLNLIPLPWMLAVLQNLLPTQRVKPLSFSSIIAPLMTSSSSSSSSSFSSSETNERNDETRREVSSGLFYYYKQSYLPCSSSSSSTSSTTSLSSSLTSSISRRRRRSPSRLEEKNKEEEEEEKEVEVEDNDDEYIPTHQRLVTLSSSTSLLGVAGGVHITCAGGVKRLKPKNS